MYRYRLLNMLEVTRKYVRVTAIKQFAIKRLRVTSVFSL